MSIKKKALWMLLSLILAILLVLWVFSTYTTLLSFAASEENQSTQIIEQLEYIIRHEIQTLDNLVFEWSNWDETYSFLEDPSQEYIDRNLGLRSFEEQNIHLMVFFDTEMEIVHYDHFQPDTFLRDPIPGLIWDFIQSPLFIDKVLEDESIFGIVAFNPPMVFSIQQVLTSEHEGPSTGWIAWGRYIDEQTQTRMQRLLGGYDFQILAHTAAVSSVPWLLSDIQKNESRIKVDNDHQMRVFRSIQTEIPANDLIIELNLYRSLYQKGLFAHRRLLVFTAISLSILCALIFWFLNKGFLSKISLLSSLLQEVQEDRQFGKRIQIVGKDEIAYLSFAVNDLLSSIENHQQLTRQNESRLKEGERIGHYGYFEWDLVGDQDYWSEELYRIFGYKSDLQVRTSSLFFRSIHPDDRSILEEHLSLALEGKPYHIQHRIVLPSGDVRHILEQAQVVFDSMGMPQKLVGTSQDITDLKHTEFELAQAKEETEAINEQLIAQNLELEKLYQKFEHLADGFEKIIQISSKISESALGKPDSFLTDLLELIINFVDHADYGSLSVFEGEKRRFVHAIGHNIDNLKKLDLFKTDLIKVDKPTKIDNLMTENLPFMRPEIHKALAQAILPIRSSIIVPFRIGEEDFGDIALDIAENGTTIFTEEDLRIAEGFANIASAFLAMQRFIIQQGRFQKELLLSMIAILELYDLYTKGHSEKVAYLSALIAEKLHLPSHEINAIYWAGLVHDIGKLLVPTQVLNKESKLTADEYEMIKMHPVWGAKVLQTSDSLRPVSRYVLFHHERWDGKGYPDEISGIEIPLASRIISVADAFDAMTSERSYRKPFSIDEAKEEMVRNSGTQFDPSIIEVFLTLDREELDKTDE